MQAKEGYRPDEKRQVENEKRQVETLVEETHEKTTICTTS